MVAYAKNRRERRPNKAAVARGGSACLAAILNFNEAILTSSIIGGDYSFTDRRRSVVQSGTSCFLNYATNCTKIDVVQ